MENLKLLRIEDVMADFSIGRTMVYKLIKQRGFPKPVKIGRSSRWIERDLENWLLNLSS